MNNYFKVTIKILEFLNVRYTKKFITESLLTDTDYPSLLSISNTFDKYNIENLSMKVDIDKFNEIPTPCIVQVIENNEPLLYTLKEISEDHVSFFNEENKLKTESKEDFLNKWTGNCLFVEKTEKTKEPGIEKRLSEKRINTFLIFSSITLLLIVLIYNLLTLNKNIDNNKFYSIVGIIILKLIGLTTTLFLLWYEIDKSNPLLQNFCSRGHKTDCDQVLNSKYSTFFKEYINLSAIGFSYFFATTFFLLIKLFDSNTFSTIQAISILTTPIIILSFYYQAFKIKKWCKFCLIIQAILVLEIIFSLIKPLKLDSIPLENLFILAFTATISLLIWLSLKPILLEQKSINYYKRSLTKLKTNKNVFETFLTKSKRISTPTENLGIEIKNQKSKIKIIKVCNPYCGPCERAHYILEELLEKELIDLQIIFTTKPIKKDFGYYPVNHLLTISKNNNHLSTKKALDDWYKIGNKDYNLFKLKNPIEITEYESELRAMNE